MPYVFVQGSSIMEEINQSISPYQRVSNLLRGKEKINTRIAPLHAELDRCPVRLVEVEDELGSLSVDDLVASARDQESRLALGRVPWLPFSVQFLIPISRAREGTTGIE